MNIFDLVTAREIATFWDTDAENRAPYIGEELFPNDKQLGLKLSWLKGANGEPVVLKASAYDVGAVIRPRIGFEKLEAEMPFFKEAKLVDEALRQELNMVMQTNNQAYIDIIVNRIFNDEADLLEGARARREQMRMQALTTGVIAVASNGQAYDYDYSIPSAHKVTVAKTWGTEGANPIEDIRAGLDKIELDTGVRPTRGMLSAKVWAALRKDENIIKSIFVLSNGQAVVNDARLRTFLLDELGVEFVVNEKRFKDDTGKAVRYLDEDTVVLFPTGTLGRTVFGTTPEESDLMTGSAANVSIVDTGVAVTTSKKIDPVNVETKVTMICLPSFEMADQVYIIDTTAAG